MIEHKIGRQKIGRRFLHINIRSTPLSKKEKIAYYLSLAATTATSIFYIFKKGLQNTKPK
jgi:hypothetical protein